ncbi:hypothetical protein L596_029030 [Steinernema carpocapsae]|uniref:Uncharacterized protein n=1 Tax=Steinernema carpocapsae TaxID=34508 RepID=A0A4U5LTF0_STECR|nr:hypothetical protein L596_029030 [Steinernema carpocapsae]
MQRQMLSDSLYLPVPSFRLSPYRSSTLLRSHNHGKPFIIFCTLRSSAPRRPNIASSGARPKNTTKTSSKSTLRVTNAVCPVGGGSADCIRSPAFPDRPFFCSHERMEHKKSSDSLHKAQVGERFLFKDSVEDCIHTQDETQKMNERPFPAYPKEILQSFNMVDHKGEVIAMNVHFLYEFPKDMILDVAEVIRAKVATDCSIYEVAEAVGIYMRAKYEQLWVCMVDGSVEEFNRCYSIRHFMYLTLDGKGMVVYHKHEACAIL